jgi:peroxiredoxin
MRKLLTAALLVSLVSLTGCQKEASTTSAKTETSSVEKGSSQNSSQKDLAYDFTFTDVNGKTHRLSDYRGKVVIVQFFGTYCPPCKMEIPALEELYKKYKDNLVVIGLSVDYIGESPEKLKPFAEQMGITYPVGPATEKAWDEYAGKITGLDSIPQTFIIDKKGRLRYYEVGYAPSYKELFEKAVKELINEK